MDETPLPLRPVARTMYVLAVLLIVSPMFELANSVLPYQPGNVQWRFGFLGLASNTIMTPTVGVVFVFAAAAVLEHRMVLRILGVLAAVAVVVLLILSGAFVLDALQLRGRVPAAQLRVYELTTAKALLTYVLDMAVLAAVALGGLRGWRRKHARTEIPLIVR